MCRLTRKPNYGLLDLCKVVSEPQQNMQPSANSQKALLSGFLMGNLSVYKLISFDSDIEQSKQEAI